MATNQTKKAKVIADGRIIEVYKLKYEQKHNNTVTPINNTWWCNYDGCSETFTSDELEFI